MELLRAPPTPFGPNGMTVPLYDRRCRVARRVPTAFLLAVASLLAGVAPLYSQDQADEWYIDKPIVAIRFVGLRHVAEVDLRPIVQPYLERAFTLDLFWELQGKLYATDLFASLESNAVAPDDDRSAVIIEFVAQERPLVGAITVTGNRGLRSSEILEVMSLARGDVFDPITLNADEAAVLALYAEKGYPDATVHMATSPDEEAGEVAVRVEVGEGYAVSVEQILFVGNQFASESTLRGRMLTKQRSLFDSGAFREATLQEDREIIAAYYASHGYVDARVERVERDLRLDEEQGRRSLVLTLYVNEGEQYRFGGMQFEGNEVFSTEELTRLLRHRADEVVNRDRVEEDFARVQDHYFENGYIFNVIELVEQRDEPSRTIAFRVIIQETDRAHIENIILSGNEKTQDHVLLRELPFEVGDVFNKTQILQGLRNLYNTQYFSAVTPETPPGSAAGLMDVVVTVEEQSTADINFGLTIGGSDFPFAASVRWNERNLGGGGQTVGAALELSPIKQSLDLRVRRTVAVRHALVGRRQSGSGAGRGAERAAGHPAAHLRRSRGRGARSLRDQGRVGGDRTRVGIPPLLHGVHGVGHQHRAHLGLSHSDIPWVRAFQWRALLQPQAPHLRHGHLSAVREDHPRRTRELGRREPSRCRCGLGHARLLPQSVGGVPAVAGSLPHRRIAPRRTPLHPPEQPRGRVPDSAQGAGVQQLGPACGARHPYRACRDSAAVLVAGGVRRGPGHRFRHRPAAA